MWIIIDDGLTFEGDEHMLDDCFAVRPNQLDAWCKLHNMKYEIMEVRPCQMKQQKSGSPETKT